MAVDAECLEQLSVKVEANNLFREAKKTKALNSLSKPSPEDMLLHGIPMIAELIG